MSEQMEPHNCCNKQLVKKGLWSQEEDRKLIDFINTNGAKHWSVLPTLAGLQRCGKSCRLRWLNYLRPDVKRGSFTAKETRFIIELHSVLGNKWSTIASYLPGRTDNEVKNLWNSIIKKHLSRKKRQNRSNTTSTSIVAPPPVTITTPNATTNRDGGGGLIGGGSSGGVSYSSAPPPPPPFHLQGYSPNTSQEFGSSSNLTANIHQKNFSASVINPEVLVPTPSVIQNPPPFQPTYSSAPPPPPPFHLQGYSPKTSREFGSFSNLTANGHQKNFNGNAINPEVLDPTPSMVQNPPSFHLQGYSPNALQEFGSFSKLTTNIHQNNFNANSINPEVFVPTPSVVQNPPPFQPTWTSNNNNYPLNFNQISQGESFDPSMFPDMDASSDVQDWDFPIYPCVNNPDSSMMMMDNAQEINNDTSILTPEEEMEFLHAIFPPLPPEPSQASSASSFLEEQAFALSNNTSALAFNQFAENPNINMFGF